MKNQIFFSSLLTTFALSAMDQPKQNIPHDSAIPYIVDKLYKDYSQDHGFFVHTSNINQCLQDCLSLSLINKAFNEDVPQEITFQLANDPEITLDKIANLRSQQTNSAIKKIYLSIAQDRLTNGTDPDDRSSCLEFTTLMLLASKNKKDKKYAKLLLTNPTKPANPFLLFVNPFIEAIDEENEYMQIPKNSVIHNPNHKNRQWNCFNLVNNWYELECRRKNSQSSSENWLEEVYKEILAKK
jgi:hypothetical protein